MAVTGRRRGMGSLSLMVLTIMMMVQEMVTGESIMDFLRRRSDLSQFMMELQRPGLHSAYMGRQVTILVPTNAAMAEYRGQRGEDLVLNHLVNRIVLEDSLGPEARLNSLVTGNPPLWVTKRSAWLYFNHARALERNISLESDTGEEQRMFIIDSVLEPLLPISVRNATFSQDVTAGKLLEKSTLYDLGNNGFTRIFYHLCKTNQRERMFDVKGRHTFFLPVDAAFDVVGKDYVDSKVVEAHIVPGQLLVTSLVPTQELPTVAWTEGGVQVTVSLQTSLAQQGQILVRSNTIVGDRVHATGMVVSRILKANIPVQNGIVHLIDKPLMVVARSLYDYLMEEGRDPENRLHEFAKLVRDKGGTFSEALLESKDGTLLAPSNEAMRRVDRERLDYILAHQHLRNEIYGLHFVRERLGSHDLRLRESGEKMFSVAGSWALNRVWFHYEPVRGKLSVEGRGINASVLESDIGTVNGVIHVVDRFLGIPHLSLAEKMRADPLVSHSWQLTVATRLSYILEEQRPGKKFTFIVPTNTAWENVRRDFSKVFKSLTDLNNPDFPLNILRRHLIIASRAYTIEELVEKSTRETSQAVDTETGALRFTSVGTNAFSAYNEWWVSWEGACRNTYTEACRGVKARVVRPNIECTNGYIHIVDTVMLDDSPPWSLTSGDVSALPPLPLLVTVVTALAMAR